MASSSRQCEKNKLNNYNWWEKYIGRISLGEEGTGACLSFDKKWESFMNIKWGLLLRQMVISSSSGKSIKIQLQNLLK